jgi:transcription elongation GreA/GreB family factor
MPSESFDTSENKKTGETLVLVKKQVLEQLIERLKTNLESLTSSRNKTRDLAKDAPSANQSHSDTSKFQLSNVQLGLESARIETEQAISLLKQIQIHNCDKVTLGAVFTIRDIDGNEKRYFLVSAAGGEILDLNGQNIASITPSAPIARACSKKNEGDTFEFQGKEFEITNIF